MKQQIIRAAERSCAHAFIIDLPEGYATQVGEGAQRFSAGQTKRIAIAQALLNDPPVLLLDEPTASLDPHAKREVENLIDEFSQGQDPALTLIWASHNLGQVKRLASRVIYLEAGRVMADLPVAVFFDAAELSVRSPQAHAFVQGELS